MLRSFITLFDRIVFALAVAGLAILFGTVMLAVLSRGIGEPVIWTDEASRFLMIWLAVLGWIMSSRKKAHIRIRFFVSLAPVKWQRLIELFMQAAITVFGGMIAWFSFDLVVRNTTIEAVTLPISMSVMYLPVFIVGLVTACHGAAEFMDALAGRMAPVEAAP